MHQIHAYLPHCGLHGHGRGPCDPAEEQRAPGGAAGCTALTFAQASRLLFAAPPPCAKPHAAAAAHRVALDRPHASPFSAARLQIGAPLQLREFASGVKVVQSASHSDSAILARIREMAQPKPEAAAAGAAAAASGAAAGGGGEAGAEAGTAAAAAAAAETPAAVAAAAAGQAGGEEAPPALLASLGPPVTRLEVALALGVSVAIAGEHLHMAEARGVLCRDEGPRGLVFYRNFFPDFCDASPTA